MAMRRLCKAKTEGSTPSNSIGGAKCLGGVAVYH